MLVKYDSCLFTIKKGEVWFQGNLIWENNYQAAGKDHDNIKYPIHHITELSKINPDGAGFYWSFE